MNHVTCDNTFMITYLDHNAMYNENTFHSFPATQTMKPNWMNVFRGVTSYNMQTPAETRRGDPRPDSFLRLSLSRRGSLCTYSVIL